MTENFVLISLQKLSLSICFIQTWRKKKTMLNHLTTLVLLHYLLYQNFSYIEETSQHQKNWDQGHKDAIKARDVNNSFYDRYHLQKNPLHEIDWEKVSYLDKERNNDRRMMKESLYISAFAEGNLMNLQNSVQNTF